MLDTIFHRDSALKQAVLEPTPKTTWQELYADATLWVSSVCFVMAVRKRFLKDSWRKLLVKPTLHYVVLRVVKNLTSRTIRDGGCTD